MSLRFIISHQTEIWGLYSDSLTSVDVIQEPVGCLYKEVSKLWLIQKNLVDSVNAEGLALVNSEEFKYYRE